MGCRYACYARPKSASLVGGRIEAPPSRRRRTTGPGASASEAKRWEAEDLPRGNMGTDSQHGSEGRPSPASRDRRGCQTPPTALGPAPRRSIRDSRCVAGSPPTTRRRAPVYRVGAAALAGAVRPLRVCVPCRCRQACAAPYRPISPPVSGRADKGEPIWPTTSSGRIPRRGTNGSCNPEPAGRPRIRSDDCHHQPLGEAPDAPPQARARLAGGSEHRSCVSAALFWRWRCLRALCLLYSGNGAS